MGDPKKRIRRAAPDRRTLSAPHGFAAPPNSVDVEENLLSAAMVDATPMTCGIAVQCGVKPAAFYGAANRRIWQIIEDLRARGESYTPAEVIEELKLTDELEEVGGVAYVLRVSGRVVTSAQVRYHAEQLVLLWQMRRTLELAGDMNQAVLGFEEREEFAKTLSEIGQRLIRFGRKEAVRTLPEQIDAIKNDVALRAAGKEDRRAWVFTGLPTFDRRLHPLNSQRLDGFTVVGGGSGFGKSALMRQFGWNVLDGGGRVLVYTRETDIESFIEQMVASDCEVDLNKLQDSAKLFPERLAKFAAECDRLRDEVANKRLWVVQHEPATPLETVEQLSQHYHAHANLYGHPEMVLVDYLQIFGTDKRTRSREEVVATVSHTFQSLQRESGNAWVVGCQLNESGLRDMRQVKRSDSGKVIHRLPCAGDLRESQAIYHDADRVIMLYRPPVDCRDRDNWGGNTLMPEIWICQIKRRKGGEGSVPCWFDKKFTRFRELAQDDAIRAADLSATGGSVQSGGQDKAKWLEEQRKKRGGN